MNKSVFAPLFLRALLVAMLARANAALLGQWRTTFGRLPLIRVLLPTFVMGLAVGVAPAWAGNLVGTCNIASNTGAGTGTDVCVTSSNDAGGGNTQIKLTYTTATNLPNDGSPNKLAQIIFPQGYLLNGGATSNDITYLASKITIKLDTGGGLVTQTLAALWDTTMCDSLTASGLCIGLQAGALPILAGTTVEITLDSSIVRNPCTTMPGYSFQQFETQSSSNMVDSAIPFPTLDINSTPVPPTDIVVLSGTTTTLFYESCMASNSYTVQSGGTLRLDGAIGGFGVSGVALSLSGSGNGAAGALSWDTGNINWDGSITLATTSTIKTSGSTTLTLNGVIEGVGGLTYEGANSSGFSTLYLAGHNTYSGLTTIRGGGLAASQIDGLGAASAGTVVESTGYLEFAISGDQTLNEPVTINGASSQGALYLRKGYTYAGAIALGLDATIYASMNSSGASTDITSIAGGVSGAYGLTVAGASHASPGGILAFTTTTPTYTGATTVKSGSLLLSSAMPLTSSSGVTVKTGAKLLGTGAVTNLVVDSGATLDPGYNDCATKGTVTTNNLSLAGAGVTGALGVAGGLGALKVDMGNTTAGTGYDQVVANGTVTLTATPKLNVSFCYVPGGSDSWTIIKNNGGGAVAGTFSNGGSNWAEGTSKVISTRTIYITYIGGASGHDVVLSMVAPVSLTTTTTTLSSSANPSSFGSSVTLSATVSNVAATGTVIFKDGGVNITGCTAQTVTTGVASCATSALAVGSRTITAVYSGDSSYATSTSANFTQTVNATAPGAPTGTSATGGNAQATVTFTAPVSNGGAAIATYTATSSPGGFTGSCVGPVACSITVSGLTNGTAYNFTVTGTNSAGTGSASSASSAVTPATVPGAPTGASATGGNAQATVTFTAPVSNGGAAISTYTATSSPGGFTGSCVGPAACSITVTGLSNGTAYTFTVTATNSAGTGSASGVSSPVSPSALAATTTTLSSSVNPSNYGSSVTLSATVNNVAATGTVIFKDGGINITGCTAQAVTTGVATCATSALAVGSRTITAVYSGDSSYATSTSANFTQTVNAIAPGVPTGVALTVGDTQLSVAFAAPSSDGGSTITGYTASCTSSDGGAAGSNTGTSSPIVVSALTNGKTYTCTVSATNGVNTGSASTASAAVVPKIPFSGGSGTVGAPYLIGGLADLQELQAVSQVSAFTGKYFKQTANIDLGSVTNWGGIGSAGFAFGGIYDGGGFAISNLTISQAAPSDDRQYAGLFNRTNGAQLRYFAVLGASMAVRGTNVNAGVLVGYAASTNITNVYVTGTLATTNIFSGGGDATGGLVGQMNASTISFSYSRVAVTSTRVTGGLVGIQSNASSSITNSFMAGSASGGSFIGQLVGDFQGGTVNYVPRETAGTAKGAGGMAETNSPSGVAATVFQNASNFQSGAGYFSSNWDFTTVWKIDAGQNNGYPILQLPNTAPTASAVAITGTAQVNVQLTGGYIYADAESDVQGTSTLRWMSDTASNGATKGAIGSATATTYTPVTGDQGKYLFFCVTPVASTGTLTGVEVCSSATAAVAAANVAPTASSVAISGTAQVNVQLTGSYIYADSDSDPQGTSTSRWMSDTASNGTTKGAIGSATATTYTPIASDAGKYLFFCVTPVASTGTLTGIEVCSSATAAVAAAAVNGGCGSASGGSTAFAPITANLCATGSAGAVAAGSPWTWSCTGSGGGSTASCTAPNQNTPNGTGFGRAVLAATNNWVVDTVNSAGFVPVSTVPSLPPGVTFPHSLFDVRLITGTAGSAATVTITYPSALPDGAAYWKYGRTASNPTAHWYQYPGAAISPDRLSITLTLTDNADGDDAYTTDSVIVDPGGPGVMAALAPAAASIPTLSEWGMIILSGLLVLGTFFAMRRRPIRF